VFFLPLWSMVPIPSTLSLQYTRSCFPRISQIENFPPQLLFFFPSTPPRVFLRRSWFPVFWHFTRHQDSHRPPSCMLFFSALPGDRCLVSPSTPLPSSHLIKLGHASPLMHLHFTRPPSLRTFFCKTSPSISILSPSHNFS